MMNSWLIDTNVLIYSYDQTSKFHKISYSLIEKAISGDINIFLSHQNLLEFTAVVTNSKRVENSLPFEDVIQKLTIYLASFQLIYPRSETFITFFKLLKFYPKLRERIFDLYLVATAFDNDIYQICTWNISDFKDIDQIIVKTPKELFEIPVSYTHLTLPTN